MEDSATSASLDRLKAWATPTHPGAQPEHLGSYAVASGARLRLAQSRGSSSSNHQVETPLLVLPPAIFLTIVGNMTGLTRDADASRFFHLYLAVEARASSRNLLTPSRATSRGSPPRLPLVCQLVVWSVHAWALFLCAIAPSTEIAVLLAPGSIMVCAARLEPPHAAEARRPLGCARLPCWLAAADGGLLGLLRQPAGHDVGLPLVLVHRLPQLRVAGDGDRRLRRPHLRGRAARPADGGAGAARPRSTLGRAPHHRPRGQPSLSPPSASPFFWQVLENRLRLPSSDLEGYWRNIAFLSIFVVFFRVLSTVMISRRLVK